MVNRLTLDTGRKARRNTNEIPMLEPLDVVEILKKAECDRDACLVALLYLSGRRVQEILALQKKDFSFSNPERVSFKTFNEKCFKPYRVGRFSIMKKGQYTLRWKGWVIPYNTRYYEAINPQYSPQGLSGLLLNHFVVDYLAKLKDDEYLFAPHRDYGRLYLNQSRAYQIIRKMDERLWLHAFRHINFTRLARVYKDNPLGMHSLTYHHRFETTIGYIRDIEKGDRLKEI